MKTLLLIPILLFALLTVRSQSADTSKIKKGIFTTYDELKEQMVRSNTDSLFYLDSTFSYTVKVPQWLDLKETGSATMFGGTLPSEKGIENAILVTGFSKKAFVSFEEFKEIYLTGNKFGQPTKYSSQHIWYGQNELISIENGVKQKVFLLWQGKIYYHMFVLLQTKSAYLFIQFTATPETYDINISKFEDFMSGFKVNSK